MGYEWKNQPPEPKTSGGRPWFGSVLLWVLFGAAVGGSTFAWTQRRELASMVKDPQARAVGRDLKQAAQDFADEYIPAAKKWEGDRTPVHPSADKLSAPVDPAHTERLRAGQKGSTSRSLGVRRRAGEESMKSAADAEEYRQDINMPTIDNRFVVPFWGTDLGRGIKYSAYFALFFGALGWFLFRNTDKHGRTT